MSLDKLFPVEPVKTNDLTVRKVLDGYGQTDYITAEKLFQTDQIVRFEVSRLLQPFAGPPGTLNRIVLLTLISGNRLFVRARLGSHGIEPPE